MTGVRTMTLPPDQDPALSLHLRALRLEHGLAERTVESYRRDLMQFAAFLEERGTALEDASAEDVRGFLAGGEWRSSTRARKTAAIRSFYRGRILAGLASSTLPERSPALDWSPGCPAP